MRIGIDAGGTFTDFVVLHDDGRLETFKLRSRPAAPHEVILEGIAQAGGASRADIVHGSTVATNALLERKGARTAFVTTAGFEDLLQIGRQNRARLYDLTPPPRRLLTPPDLCFGVEERTYFDGASGGRPSPASLARLRTRLRDAGVESVAICFLHSYQDPANEQAARQALSQLGYVCASHEISPEYREYERASTTVINAYVGPLIDAYLRRLEGHSIAILQSNGGVLTAAEARRQAVRTILSGPAGGVVGAAEVARASGFRAILGFDMGGTSTDVSLSDGRPRVTTEATVDGFPIRVPALDIHTVGAGGGSLARVDAGGLLRVGPESAGADPGPACYGIADQPTVTDAHVVLGRIAADQFLGGAMTLYPGRSAQAVDRIAAALGVSRVEAAAGIVRVANANMERAIRVVSVERGEDPRDYVLVAFGGCGGLHACEIAHELGVRTVVVPEFAGALSALGMLLADRVRDYSASVLGSGRIAERFAEMEAQARAETPGCHIERRADLRYTGQSYEITVPWNERDPAVPFHAEHRRVYGACEPTRAIEVVTLRLRATLAVDRPSLDRPRRGRAHGSTERRVYVGGAWQRVPALDRHSIRRGMRGPALVTDYGSTTLVPANWRMRVDRVGSLLLVHDR